MIIHILPGMGADSAMYRGPWRQLQNCTFHDWPCDTKADSIQAIARQIAENGQIQDGDVVVGTSLGGIVGCEISKQRKLKSLLLISSAKKKEEISNVLEVIYPLIDLAPLKFIQLLCGKAPGELMQMFSRTHADFIRTACRAIFAWEGLDEAIITPRRIHGRNDHVIPLPENVDEVVNGGHLIAMTHATECVEFVIANSS